MVVTKPVRQWLSLLVLCIPLGGCSVFGWGQEEPPDPSRQVSMQAALDSNRNVYGRPSPVVVRVFQLAQTEAFEEADFFALSTRAEAALGGDLLKQQRLVLRPGQQQSYRFIPEPGVNHLGVMAEYRSVEQARWRAVLGIDPPPGHELRVSIARDVIELTHSPIDEQHNHD